MHTELENRCRIDFVEDNESGKTVLEEGDRTDNFIEKIIKKGGTAEVSATQGYTYYNVTAESLDSDFAELVPDINERVNLVNTALDLKAQSFIRKTMLDKNFSPTEGAYDLHDIYALVTERKTASPEEKAANALSKLLKRTVSVDELAGILAGLTA